VAHVGSGSKASEPIAAERRNSMPVISCISLFFCKRAKPAARDRTRVRATKNPPRHAARAPELSMIDKYIDDHR
jgi:hypothetical protein